MATLRLTSLECIRRFDVVGSDEPHLYVGQDLVWNGVLSKGETENLRGGQTDPIDFDGSVDVVLREMSNGVLRQIAYPLRISDRPKNDGELTFKTSGTHYELRYKVEA